MVSSLIFQKFSGEGLTEPPPQTPPPAFSRASPSVRASPSILRRFAPSTRASPLILGRFAPSIRALPLTFNWGPWFGPPQNKFLDPPLGPTKLKRYTVGQTPIQVKVQTPTYTGQSTHLGQHWIGNIHIY